jgi:hydroxymethylglutaryl-CoA reductase (NADPH)
LFSLKFQPYISPISVFLPLATTEGALIASINRGCKAASIDGVTTKATYKGMTRSIALSTKNPKQLHALVKQREHEWKTIGERTSAHLKILSFDVDEVDDLLFLTIACDTDLAMGMNMVTIAAQAIGAWISEQSGATLVTIAANVDSDKKPNERTLRKGRGWTCDAWCDVSDATLHEVLKTNAVAFCTTYKAKIEHGSRIAGALGANGHSANVIAALYLATGQDIAHAVEGSLATTTVEPMNDGIRIAVHLPAILIGVIGGGTQLPAQKTALSIVTHEPTALKKTQQCAEVTCASVLAGELSLLAALSSHDLAKAHKNLGRTKSH